MSDTVQQIKDKLNIIDVVSPYVELHKAGKNFKGKSPFSAEKTPSFYVSPDRGMYYCFSTSQGGDIFNFIQAMEGVDFKESLKILAQKAGVELVPEDPKKRSERDRLYAAIEAATVFYSEALEKEPVAKAYLEQRGVTADTISKWRIGYAPGPPAHGWRETKDHLEAKKFTKDELLKAGLIKTTEGGKEPFDVFRDRVMFPMAETSGKIVAFSGRILTKDTEAPKYVNSPETSLYKKSALPLRYDKAKTGIRSLGFSRIFEGQFDVVMCHQAGYANTVAVSGTALTLHHVQLLERLSEKVVLALDADRAGIAAVKKAAELMLSRGLDVKVAELPEGKDPADIIAEKKADFKKIIGSSVHVIEFLLHVLKRQELDSRTYKLQAREEILPFILLLPSRIDQEHFVTLVAEAIGSTTEAVRYELDRLRDEGNGTRASLENSSIISSTYEKAGAVVDKTLQASLFLHAAIQLLDKQMAAKLMSQLTEVLKIDTTADLDSSALAGVVFTLEQQFAALPKRAVAEEVVAKLNHLKVSLVRKRLAELKVELAAAEQVGDETVFANVLENIKKYETQLREPCYEVETMFSGLV